MSPSDWERTEQAQLGLLHFPARQCKLRERPLESVEDARCILEVDSCHQEAHLLTMQGLLLSGRPEEAVRQYELCCRALKRELGMEPGMPVVEACYRARPTLQP